MYDATARLYIAGILLVGLVMLPDTARSATGVEVHYTSGNETISGYLALPDGQGAYPALIAVHEWWGLNDWMKQSADRLADEGYIVLAVDLFRGKTAGNAEEAHELSRSLSGEQAINDLMAAVAYLKSRQDVRSDKIGAVGWSMGGGYALTMALTVPDLAACVINYGRLVTERTSIEKIACPVLGIFGEDDRSIPSRSVRSFEKACQSAGKSVEVHIHPDAGHAFMNENETRGYNADATEKAWGQIITFLDQTLQ